jgi:uncharacterized protein YjeT (DUF2065 family)
MFKFWAETLRNFGVGLMVSAFVLRISKDISYQFLLRLLMFGLVNVGIGAILYHLGGEE